MIFLLLRGSEIDNIGTDLENEIDIVDLKNEIDIGESLTYENDEENGGSLVIENEDSLVYENGGSLVIENEGNLESESEIDQNYHYV
jgi:hypothetical protein